MRVRTKINSLISFLAAGLLAIFGRSPAKPTTKDLSKMEFKSSTQRLGVRFRERIRDVFRFKWIKKKTSKAQPHYSQSTGIYK